MDRTGLVSKPVMNDVILITGASSGIGAETALAQSPHVDVNEILVRPTPPITGVAPGGRGSGE